MSKQKEIKDLANPFSTGGGGWRFESRAKAVFALLMLAGGRLPYFRHFPYPWRIAKIQLQTRIDGYATSDMAVIFENHESAHEENRKLLIEAKSSIRCNAGDKDFKEVIGNAWYDFNSERFAKGKDAIALVTGALSSTDQPILKHLVNGAKYRRDHEEAARKRKAKNYSPQKTDKKYKAIADILEKKNKNRKVSEERIHEFLKHLYILQIDIGDDRNGSIPMSLLMNLISKFYPANPEYIWLKIISEIESQNQESGTIDFDSFENEVKNAFYQKDTLKRDAPKRAMPEDLRLVGVGEHSKINTWQPSDSKFLAQVLLLGAWEEQNEHDRTIVVELLDKGGVYLNCSEQAQEILNSLRNKSEEKFNFPKEFFVFKRGVWRVKDRVKVWKAIGANLIEPNIEVFKGCAVSVLSDVETPKYSRTLRKSIAEGLAILGNNSDVLSEPEVGKKMSGAVIREVFSNADKAVWGGLSDLLPTLAEVSPRQFLNMLTNALSKAPSPFDSLLSQEDGVYGYSHATEITMAMECLAWDKECLVDVCMALGKMASLSLPAVVDEDTQWSNAPFNSLVRILLPWLPKPKNAWQERKAAMETLMEEFPDVGLKVLFSLLPGARVMSSDICKPKWRAVSEEPVLRKQYREEVSFYSSMLIKRIGYDVDHLTTLIDKLAYLSERAFNLLAKTLKSSVVVGLSDKERFPLWLELVKFSDKHRIDEEIELVVARVEEIAKLLAPKSPFYLHQKLLAMYDIDYLDNKGDRDEQRARLFKKQEAAVRELLKKYDFNGVLQFSDESVPSPYVVGRALGFINNRDIERNIFPDFLEDPNINRQELARGVIVKKFSDEDAGWKWFDTIDKSKWTSAQLGCFLAHFRFNNKTWEQVSKWLKKDEREYWSRAGKRARIYPRAGEKNLPYGLAMLIKHGNVALSINLLRDMLYGDFSVDIDLYVQALLCLIDSDVKVGSGGSSILNEMIRHVHRSGDSANKDDVLKIERHFALHVNFYPKIHAQEMADNPEFFCKVVRWAHFSSHDGKKHEDPDGKLMAIASQWLRKWKDIPGSSKSGKSVSVKSFIEWFDGVKEFCEGESYWTKALGYIGGVLANTPADSSLWINRDFAKFLNKSGDNDYVVMRDGFINGLEHLHSESAFTCESAKMLEKNYKLKAKQLRLAGYRLLANAVKEVADHYGALARDMLGSGKDDDENGDG